MQYTIGFNGLPFDERELVKLIATSLAEHGYNYNVVVGAGLYVNGLPERHILFEKVNNENHIRRR